MAHAVWNIIGAIFLGCVNLTEDYPHMFTLISSQNTLLSGGEYKIKASIIVTIINIVLTVLFLIKLKLLNRNKKIRKRRNMYITKYWGDFIGGSDDSMSLVEFLDDLNKEEITLKEIFTGIGLDRQNMDFRQTVENLGFIKSTGLEMDFYYAIDVVTDLAAILLECKISGHVNLRDLDDNEDAKNRCIRVVATEEEYTGIKAALEAFVKDPKSYDLYEMIGDDIIEMAEIVKELRKDLLQYEL